jgi:chromosome segregation ATPase
LNRNIGDLAAKNTCGAVESQIRCDATAIHHETIRRRFRVPRNEENFKMVCSMVKKGLLAAGLGAGTLFLLFGTAAPSYVRTAFHRVRQNAKDAVNPQFDIDRAREEIDSLKPAIEQNIETLARAEVEAEHLEREVTTTQTNLDQEKKALLSLKESLKTGEFRLAGHVVDTADEVKATLAHRYDHYKYSSKILADKKEVLKAKRKTIKAAHEQLEDLRTQKSALLAKLASIEAKLQMIQATQAKNEFHFDNSALARAKETVSELEERLEVLARKAEMEGRYSELSGSTPYVEPGRDVVKEVEDEFGQTNSRPASKPGDKSL